MKIEAVTIVEVGDCEGGWRCDDGCNRRRYNNIIDIDTVTNMMRRCVSDNIMADSVGGMLPNNSHQSESYANISEYLALDLVLARRHQFQALRLAPLNSTVTMSPP